MKFMMELPKNKIPKLPCFTSTVPRTTAQDHPQNSWFSDVKILQLAYRVNKVNERIQKHTNKILLHNSLKLDIPFI